MEEMVILNGQAHPMEQVAVYMDDEIREQLHFEMVPCEPQEFLDEYCKRHAEKYDTYFNID